MPQRSMAMATRHAAGLSSHVNGKCTLSNTCFRPISAPCNRPAVPRYIELPGVWAPNGQSAPRTRTLQAIGPRRLRIIAAAAATAPPAAPEVFSRHFDDAGLGVSVHQSPEDGSYVVDIKTDSPRPELILHWGVDAWKAPPQDVWPQGTVPAGDKAARTSFGESGSIRVCFPESSAPARLVFVLNEGQEWLNNGGSDYSAMLKPPGVNDLVDRVIEAEARYDRWSLFNRMCMANQVLDEAMAAGPDGMALVFTWLRLSSMRQLDWYRGSNYQSKDAAHAQKTVAQRMAHAAHSAADPLSRLFARGALAGLPRGGGNGDDIRHGILNVMRENGIREGHRPGIQDDFLESWHQKLHTNTTPEDIAICEGYLAFLRSGNMDDFWRVAWDVGRVTRESLASMDHPVNPTPCHLPHLIGPMQHYLWILKTTHAGADLDVAFEMCRGFLDGDLAWSIGDLLSNRNEWWVPGKIVEVRRRLEPYWRADGASRDILLLDIALDSYFRLCVERTDKGALGRDDLFNLVQLVLDNNAITGESPELAACAALWARVGSGEPNGRWSGREWGLAALAAADNVSLCLEAHADGVAALVQPHAERFGAECSLDPAFVVNFAEEVVRGQPVFILSPLLRFLGPALREAARVGAWQVVSQGGEQGGPAMGRLRTMPDLIGIQGTDMPESTVIIASTLSGNEDIPQGVAAVLTGSATDVLSHVAIRARAQGVLLATCFDPAQLEAIAAEMEGKWVEAGVTPAGDVGVLSIAEPTANDDAASNGGKNGGGASTQRLKLAKPAAVGNEGTPWVLTEKEFAEGLVGGKARNLAALRGKVPDWIGVPSSIALPFGTFERVLKDPVNTSTAKLVKDLQAELAAAKPGSGVPSALQKLRRLIRSELVAPEALVTAAAAAAESAGLLGSACGAWKEASGAEWTQAWDAIRAVWASKWNDRAWLSRRAQGVEEDELYMSVLLQTIVPARYAFVLHTADPLTGAAGQLHGEVVAGMGEALVGNFPGRALSFSTDGQGGSTSIIGLPSKREALLADGGSEDGTPLLIARSDSNGEDLEEFAGAGLYSSIPLIPLRRYAVRYAEEQLFWGGQEREALLAALVKAGMAVEEVCGSPQDVEGAVDADGRVHVVQARPQVIKA